MFAPFGCHRLAKGYLNKNSIFVFFNNLQYEAVEPVAQWCEYSRKKLGLGRKITLQISGIRHHL
jgi:hypothetical protein